MIVQRPIISHIHKVLKWEVIVFCVFIFAFMSWFKFYPVSNSLYLAQMLTLTTIMLNLFLHHTWSSVHTECVGTGNLFTVLLLLSDCCYWKVGKQLLVFSSPTIYLTSHNETHTIILSYHFFLKSQVLVLYMNRMELYSLHTEKMFILFW